MTHVYLNKHFNYTCQVQVCRVKESLPMFITVVTSIIPVPSLVKLLHTERMSHFSPHSLQRCQVEAWCRRCETFVLREPNGKKAGAPTRCRTAAPLVETPEAGWMQNAALRRGFLWARLLLLLLNFVADSCPESVFVCDSRGACECPQRQTVTNSQSRGKKQDILN